MGVEELGLEPDYKLLRKPDRADRDLFDQHLIQVLMRFLREAVTAFITVTFHGIEEKDICQVTVEPSGHPVYLQDNAESALYLRTGNSTRPLPVQEAVKYVSTRWELCEPGDGVWVENCVKLLRY